MSVNNDVYQVLVGTEFDTTGGNTIESLGTSGSPAVYGTSTVGMFNAKTNLSVTNVAGKFYFAARNGEDLSDNSNLTFSPQFCIDPIKIKAMSAMNYRAGQNQISYLNGFHPEVTEREIELGKILQTYGMKISVENKKIMKLLGIGAYTKSVFSDKVGFDTSDDSGIFYDTTQTPAVMKTGTALVEAYQLYKKYAVLLSLYYAINRNEDDYFQAYFVQGIPAADSAHESLTGVFADDVNTFATAEDGGNEVFLVIESKPLNKAHFSQINMHYYKDRFTSLNISLIEGFCCGAEIVTVLKAAPSVGEGYDVMYREYRAGGWNGRPGPYRTYAVTGLAKDEIVYHADQNKNYDLFSITYEIERIAGWLYHRSWVTVEIALEANNSVTCGDNPGEQAGPDWFEAIAQVAEAAGATVHRDCNCYDGGQA